ncbi:hypothetical protein A3F07_01865 [candidate division WWE3 bacterium RIFCSPHIGHO2_12_FULL_38_15]|uniref:Peptidase S11 D-alanyl-D-alanine carboxypeptidase A N-terminal domain-containing protein n=1 Tax=candidate division WWE3 bacterium RIFCSPHIGHO2_02_FULL_38_14 TaxID=1802620 RepID=A0A1F4VB13_UNCKA|nr:MAG: hypothetical protein A3F07_01865 [candidate division WWE3 bacterium RIFCSPHIGHO2_12_FULL_38_15]OGC52881.1 MAG: hypothetical protein A3B64_03640 [candidate division WWE3 bacterium RIFCSPLOWO2_01_FULL_37_24]OGC54384.1 MAG: hypothetical protein A3D91_00615 [candidate division WWE3 bacterium RIFCSPHIGHO2_02_FULL_38_14]HLB51628.1 hypothetical protein [Patescibacteria group bacterium]
MEMAVNQKIKLFIIKFFINLIWILDYITSFPSKIYSGAAVTAALMILVSFYIPGTPTNIKLTWVSKKYSYISDYFYESVNYQNKHNYPQVLGVKTTKIDYPYLASSIEMPAISAKSAIIIDKNSGKTLFELNKNLHLAPASTTKLMTALVSLDLYNLEDYLIIPYLCTLSDSQKIGFSVDSKVRVRDLLIGLLVGSGGDSACALSTGKVTANEFLNLMNKKAKDLGMDNTQFTNPVGLDGAHFSTAEDLYKLAQYATESEVIKNIVKLKNIDIPVLNSDGINSSISVVSTNKLLWDIKGSVGIKTGKTEAAGEVLIYEYKNDKLDKDLIIIVMGSQDRFLDTQNLLFWTLNSYKWEKDA